MYQFLILDYNQRFCAAHINYIGNNYPCARDFNKPPYTSENTSYVFSVDSKTIEFGFNQLTNWGK